jgi:hypothetical protein
MNWLIKTIASKYSYFSLALTVLAVAAFAAYRQMAGSPVSPVTIMLVTITPAIALLLIACARTELVYNNQQLHHALLRKELMDIKKLLFELDRKKGKSAAPVVEILSTSYEIYRGMNEARDQSTKSLHLMKIHFTGPKDDNIPIGKELSPEQLDDKSLVEKHIWYNGLTQWNTPGRFIERVTVRTSESMLEFIDVMKEQMKGTDYSTYILDWNGTPPLINLCVFDHEQIFISFSTQLHENAYSPVKGLRIKSPVLAEFFYNEYYVRLRRISKLER